MKWVYIIGVDIIHIYLSVIVYTAHPETVAVPAVDDGNDDRMWVAEENI